MFKVHYSSTSLAESQGRFHIVDTIHKTWNLMKQNYMLRKSYGLYHNRADGTTPIRDWSPEAVLNPPEHMEWYDQFQGPEGRRAHHTPYGYNPKTGELEFHRDGSPAGKHPLDYMMSNMLFRLRKDLEKQGFDPNQLTMEYMKALFQQAINLHNAQHPPEQQLPHVDHVDWRRVHVGPNDKDSVGGARQNRSEKGELITYSLNQGNLHDLEGSDKGAWIDGGVNPMHGELHTAYDMFMNWLRGHFQGFQPPEASSFRYLNSPTVRLDDMTFKKVRAMTRNEAEEHFGPEGSGYVPGTKSSTVIDNYHPLDFVEYAPKALFSQPVGKVGGKARQSKDENTGEVIDRAREIQGEMASVGVPMELEEAFAIAQTPISQALVRGPNHRLRAGHRFNTILRGVAENLGVNMDSGAYKRLLEQIDTRGNAVKGTKHLYAIPWMLSMKLVAQGVPNEEAWQQAIEAFRNSDYQHSNHNYDEAHHANVMDFTKKLRATDDHAGQMAQTVGAIAPRHDTHPDHDRPTQIPQHWNEHIGVGSVNRSATAHRAHEAAAEQVQSNQMPVDPPYAMPQPDPSAPPPDEQRALLEQVRGSDNQRVAEAAAALTPGQTRLPLGQEKEVLTTMERIQMYDAKQDLFVKSVAVRKMKLSQPEDVRSIAKSLGIHTMDVHGIYHSQGDWYRIANDWDVKPEVVKAVKVAFGGIL